MPLNSSKALEFSRKLIEWFWQFGGSRSGVYKLQTSGWLREVYEASEQIDLAEKSAENLRPAFAIWGPSQSGKSTFLSNFLDEKVWSNLQPDDPVDAGKSGLSWPGADPCVFFVDLPGSQLDRYQGNSLNPFTGGKDASAVLTRFVRGSLERKAGVHHIPHPKYPVQLHFLGEKQVMHALAMGYDSDCLGDPRNKWQQNEWSQTEFRNVLDQFNAANPVSEATPANRQAFEIIGCLCEVLMDLVAAKVRRFQKLSLSAGSGEWQSRVFSLLEQPSLLASPENARKFASLMLWDGAEPISEYYDKVLRMLADIKVMQGDKPVYTTLTVATKLLDMDTYEKVDNGTWKLPKICYREESDAVLVDLNEGQPLVENVEQFGSLQGLVWEIVVPVNFDNLSPSKFTEYLGKGDLLDFPGVANEQANDVKKIAAWSNIREKESLIPEKDRLSLDPKQLFTPNLFFTKILKRGKTASIVNTYAKRLTIDGFTIVQYLDKHPPVNADQIQSGISTWWDCMAPEYDHNYGGQSPLPLNLALTWWPDLFGTYQILVSRGQEFFPPKMQILQALGKVSDPCVLWSSTALHYYKIPIRGEVKNEFVPAELFAGLLKEKDVVRQFASLPLRQSLDAAVKESDSKADKNLKDKFAAWAKQHDVRLKTDDGLQTLKIMLEDRNTGGAVHLLTLLCAQLDKLVKDPLLNRAKILEESRRREVARLEKMLQGPYMFPPPETRDTRRENLQMFKKNLEQATTRQAGNQVSLLSEEEMAPVNQALREFLNVDYTDVMIPSANQQVSGAFIYQQYQAWIRKQVARWRSSDNADSASPSSWSRLGLTSSGLVEMLLNSLVDSITLDQREEMAEWLRRDVRVGQDGAMGSERTTAAFLAVKMSNYLVGDHGINYDETKPPSYVAVIEPFLSEQLPALLGAPVRAMVQVAVPGTKELEALCKEYDIKPPVPA